MNGWERVMVQIIKCRATLAAKPLGKTHVSRGNIELCVSVASVQKRCKLAIVVVIATMIFQL